MAVRFERAASAKPSQRKKAAWPMTMTDGGIATLARFLHPANARLPIVITELGMATPVSLPHYARDSAPRAMTDVGMA